MRLTRPEDLKKIVRKLRQKEDVDARVVRDILDDVDRCGDRALFRYSLKFDGVTPTSLQVPIPILRKGYRSMDPSLKESLQKSAERIRTYHCSQKQNNSFSFHREGIRVYYRSVPLTRVGIYIPAGKAPLVSTVLMTVIPASVAGVKEIVACSPPSNNGSVHPAVAGALYMLGVRKVYAVGGAQAIAAMAYGTETVCKVDKVIGPGNLYVNEAKRLIFGRTGIDLLAGPSELVVLADSSADAEMVVADLSAQAEHGSSPIFFITTDSALGEKVAKKVDTGWWFQVASIEEGLALANAIAPEHLEIIAKNARTLASKAIAGAVFLGNFSPCAMGDYFAGPSHVLPTGGSASFLSGLSVFDFLRSFATIEGSREGMQKQAMTGETIASFEGMELHRRSLELRRKKNSADSKKKV